MTSKPSSTALTRSLGPAQIVRVSSALDEARSAAGYERLEITAS